MASEISKFQTQVYFGGIPVRQLAVFKHNQQDATIHNVVYYNKRSTCFRRFLRPSSGAQNCKHSIG